MRLFLARPRSPLIAAAAMVALSVPARAQASFRRATAAASHSAQAAPPVAAPPPAPQTPPPAPAGPLSDTSTSLFALASESAPALWPLEQHFGRPGALAAVPGPSRRPAVHRRSAAAGNARVEAALSRPTTSAGAISAMSATYERVGRLQIRGLWDEIPQFYSVDTRTAYTPTATDGTLVLPDAVQQSIQNGTANLNAYVPSPSRRNSTCASAATSALSPSRRCRRRSSTSPEASPRTKHSGELPWGASFGFSNDVEVPLPYESRTNDLDIGLEWHNTKSMLRTAYTNSWFDNQADTLIWDSPLRLTDGVETPGTWPYGAVAVQLDADVERRRPYQAGATDAGDGLAGLRLVEQRPAAAALHDQQRAADVRAAARQRRRQGADRSPPTSVSCRVRPTTGGSARGSGATTSTTTRRPP